MASLVLPIGGMKALRERRGIGDHARYQLDLLVRRPEFHWSRFGRAEAELRILNQINNRSPYDEHFRCSDYFFPFRLHYTFCT